MASAAALGAVGRGFESLYSDFFKSSLVFALISLFCGWISWDPSRIAFHLPFVHHPVAWYGIIFALAFVLAYWTALSLLKERVSPTFNNSELCSALCSSAIDRLTWFLVIGTIIGARLGEVFFYDWPAYRDHPIDIVKIWQGGLASHGGAAGVLLALAIFCYSMRSNPIRLPYLAWLDLLAAPIALVSVFIRLGNFVNQEIIGPPTTLPWAIIFEHPLDGSAPVPRHPTQLYEAIAYFIIFALLYLMGKRGSWRYIGRLSGTLILLVFLARFCLEFVKLPLSSVIDESTLHMGQYLSLPFIFLGIFLLLYSRKNHSLLLG